MKMDDILPEEQSNLDAFFQMFDWVGETKGDADCKAGSDFIELAVTEVLKGDTLTYDLGGTSGTSDVGDAIVNVLEAHLRKHFAVA